jgi:anti-anti-sigma regulatory factor
MPITIEHDETGCLLRLEGQVILASAEPLKKLLLECLATGKDVALNLEGVEEIDIAILQLLSTAARNGVRIVGRVSGAVGAALDDSGFARIPGFPVPEQ